MKLELAGPRPDMDDLDAIDLVAREVLPAFR